MLLVRALWLTTLLTAAVAQPKVSRTASSNLRVESDLVLINVLVTDSHGKIVPDLDHSRFHLFEEGQEQVIKYCSSTDVPISIGLVLDASGSMGEKLSVLKKAAIEFVRAANPLDEYFLLEFRDRPEVVVPFMSDTDQLMKAVDSMKAGGSTAFLDAIYLALQEVRTGRNARRAVVVVSDGMDNHSRYSERETKRLALEADSPLYAINLWEPQRSGNRYAIQRRDPGLLEQISAPTGGRTFAVRDSKKLLAAAELISSEIRSEYILGYVPSNRRRDGKFRHVSVRVDPSAGGRSKGLKVSSRSGYYSPVE